MKLIIIDRADPSVGLFEQRFDIDVPFERGDVEPEDFEFFREGIKNVFCEFNQGKTEAIFEDDVNE